MVRLLLIADSKRYVLANCYQHQLYRTLRNKLDVAFVSASEILGRPTVVLDDYDCVLSVLRLRSLVDILQPLQSFLRERELFIYEQDPWEAFRDDSPYKGSYERIYRSLNVAAFLNTSLWWSRFIQGRGLPSVFVRMGMLPEYCNVGKLWVRRRIALGFQGVLHPHRKAFFDQLARLGTDVTILPSSAYKRYLRNLHTIRIYIHTEDAPWVIDGKPTPRNALWIKDTEAAARGCFAIRNYEEEAHAYGIEEIPTIFTFREIGEVPGIIDRINRFSETEKSARLNQAVQRLKARDDWTTVVDAIGGRGR